MAWVAVAIGGSAAVGAGAGIYGGMQQSKAAKKAANAQSDAMRLGIQQQQAGKAEALNYLDPVRQWGLNAGSTLQSMLYSPEQLRAQQQSELLRLQGDVATLKDKEMTFDEWHRERGAQYTGGKGLKRSRGAHAAYSANLTQQMTDAQGKLNLYQQQSALQNEQAAQGGPEIEASPWYKFQAELFSRNEDRANSARGLTGSGFEAEARRVGMLQLGGEETERQFGRLYQMLGIGANAAAQGAGVITGTAQGVSNLQVGIGQAQAQGYMGVAGGNASAASGVANSITGSVGAGLHYSQMQNLINANRPAAPVAGSSAGATPGSSYPIGATKGFY